MLNILKRSRKASLPFYMSLNFSIKFCFCDVSILLVYLSLTEYLRKKELVTENDKIGIFMKEAFIYQSDLKISIILFAGASRSGRRSSNADLLATSDVLAAATVNGPRFSSRWSRCSITRSISIFGENNEQYRDG